VISQGTDLTLIQSTVTGNQSNNTGGLYLRTYTDLTITNSIIANSTSHDCYTSSYLDIPTNGVNIIQAPGNCTFTGAAPLQVDPMLGPLADNGGSTLTHALTGNSPAVDAGVNAEVPVGLTTDQRGIGFPRIEQGTVDLGSFEFKPLPDKLFCSSFEINDDCSLE
jgi:hypothetical protein